MNLTFIMSIVGSSIIGYNTTGWIGVGVWFCLFSIHIMVVDEN